MIRAGSPGRDGNDGMLLLGLSADNVRALVDGQVMIRLTGDQLAELGLPRMGIVIMYGQTESGMFAELQAHGVQFGTVHDRRPT